MKTDRERVGRDTGRTGGRGYRFGSCFRFCVLMRLARQFTPEGGGDGGLNWLILLWTEALCFSTLSWSYGKVQKSRSVMSAMILPLPVPLGVNTQCWSARWLSDATSESKRAVYSGCFAHWICLPGSIGQFAISLPGPHCLRRNPKRV